MRQVRGVLFVDYVRMLRSQKKVDWAQHLAATDLAYLQEFYRRINEEGAPKVHAKCPSCQTEFDVDLLGGGGAAGTGG